MLKDTVNNFDLRLAQAENAITTQDATIEITRINLDQGVDNGRIALERAEQAYKTLTDKNAISYDMVVNTNGKTLDAYNQNYKTYITDTDRLMTQLMFEADKILGITSANEYANDGWESYLWVHNGTTYSDAKKSWNRVYAIRGTIRAKMEKNPYLSSETLTSDLELVGSGYTELQKFSDAMILMIENNVVWAALPQDLQNGWITAWNGHKTQTQWAEAGYNGWKSQTIPFFTSYRNTELANRLALDSTKRSLTLEEQSIINGSTDIRVTYESARIDLVDRIANARLSLEQGKLSYENARKIRNATLDQLQESRKNTQIALDQARRDYGKLSISAPVDGTVTRVIANIGQSITLGTPVIEFSGKQPQIVVDIDTPIANSLTAGNLVSISVDSTTLTGVITAVSNISNANLLSTIRMSIAGGEKYIGKSAVIGFQSVANTAGTIRLPVNAVKIVSEEEWEVSLYTGSGTIEKMMVKLWRVWDTNIEVIWSFSKNSRVITSDVSNYDASKNILTIE